MSVTTSGPFTPVVLRMMPRGCVNSDEPSAGVTQPCTHVLVAGPWPGVPGLWVDVPGLWVDDWYEGDARSSVGPSPQADSRSATTASRKRTRLPSDNPDSSWPRPRRGYRV